MRTKTPRLPEAFGATALSTGTLRALPGGDSQQGLAGSSATGIVGTDPLLTVREGAAELCISVPTFWRHVKTGTIPKPVKIGALSRWPRSEILGVIEAAKARRDAE